MHNDSYLAVLLHLGTSNVGGRVSHDSMATTIHYLARSYDYGLSLSWNTLGRAYNLDDPWVPNVGGPRGRYYDISSAYSDEVGSRIMTGI